MTERLEAIVHGKVQRVMFRDFVQRKASGLGLTGEVQNSEDGTVHVLAEGEHVQLEKLLEKLHHGPLLAHVENVTSIWSPASGEFNTFKIKYGK